ncbi:unnamed protein product [Peniophora sp. CBMAI 1063]|nr:unnamed protein product [Peniophora sp. CBMAI 1063]
MSFDLASSSASAQINRLPNELLAEIFVRTHDILSFYGDNPTYEGAALCAFLSHVCRRWRSVAISCQYLWASLPCKTEKWTKACLARAHSGPVALQFYTLPEDDFMASLSRETCNHLFDTIPRAISLDAWLQLGEAVPAGILAHTDEVLRALLEHEAPLLEDLTIRFEEDNFEEEESNEPHILPSLFLEKTPSKLQHVYLEGCALPFPQTIFSAALTTLKLDFARIWTNMDQMVEFMRTVPLLKDFEYENYGDPASYGFDPALSRVQPLRCVTLAHLRRCHVQAAFVVGIRMFSYLAFPPDASLCLSAYEARDTSYGQHYTDIELEGLIAFGSKALRAHYAGYMERTGRHYDSIEVGRNTLSHVSESRDELEFGFGMPEVDAPDAHRLRAAVAAMYLTIPVIAHTKMLVLHEDWEGFTLRDLSYCKNVERLHIKGNALAIFAKALSEGDMLDSASFPVCSEIIIGAADFSLPTREDAHSRFRLQPDWELQLAETLQRYQTNRGGECTLKIVFNQCKLGPRTMETFQTALGADRVHTTDQKEDNLRYFEGGFVLI